MVQELPIGGSPALSNYTNNRLAAVNNSLVREIQATWAPPHGQVVWASPDVTALLIMIGIALERAAKYGKLEAYEEARAQAVNSAIRVSPHRTTPENPRYDEDATTEPMRMPLPPIPDMGDE